MTRPAAPDILWVVTTQWRAQATGYAGDPNARTPFLDEFAATALNYTQAVTPHPFGPFARAALLTGEPSPGNGVRGYFDPLPRQARTIAHALNDRGYTSAYFGKWHLSSRDPALPLVGEAHAKLVVAAEDRGGFQFWEGFEGGFLLNDVWLHGSRLQSPTRFPGYQSDVVGRRASDWLRALTGSAIPAATRPWFAVVSLESPHPPYDAPAPVPIHLGPDELVLPPNVPRGGAAENRARRELAGYYRHITATDHAFRKLVTHVDETAARAGRAAPIVVFTSVHGDMHGAHGLFRKGWPHEESLRVPLLVRLPQSPSGGEFKTNCACSLLDLTRMTLACADATPMPSTSPWSLISMPGVVALAHQCDRAWRGVRTPARKLVLNDDGTPWLFFDLETDPHELRNLAFDATRATEVHDLRRMAGF